MFELLCNNPLYGYIRRALRIVCTPNSLVSKAENQTHVFNGLVFRSIVPDGKIERQSFLLLLLYKNFNFFELLKNFATDRL